MEEPDWAKVLNVIYERGGQINYPAKGIEPDDDHILVQNTGLGIMEIRTAVDDLRRSGLIQELEGTRYSSEEVTNDRLALALSEKGFDVGHQRELKEKQQNLLESQNEATDTLANFTIILGVTALIQALAAIVSLPRFRIPLSVIYAGLLVILLYKKDDWLHGM